MNGVHGIRKIEPDGGKATEGEVGGSVGVCVGVGVGVSANHSISVKDALVLRLSACPGHK